MASTVGFVLATKDHFEYAAQAIHSAQRGLTVWKTDASRIVVGDDQSQVRPDYYKDQLRKAWPEIRILPDAFPLPEQLKQSKKVGKPKGCTWIWNAGLRLLRSTCDFVVVCNDDVIFGKGWDAPFAEALMKKQAYLVGPVTNAPGKSSPVSQDVRSYLSDYVLSDEPEQVDETSAKLLRLSEDVPQLVPGIVNGFCMAASTEEWFARAARPDLNQVFDERYFLHNNEHDFQRRNKFTMEHCPASICTRSFVFHYRSLTRGNLHLTPGWYRTRRAITC